MEFRPRLNASEYALIMAYRNGDTVSNSNNTLIIGDLHEPFTKRGYLDHCLRIQDKYKTDRTIFIGDLLDNHFSSFFATDPDGQSALDELDKSKAAIGIWHKFFPGAYITVGNHDRLPQRKAMAGGISQLWIKSMSEVLETPTWEYGEQFMFDGVLYIHGEGRQADVRAKNDQVSVVQGHWHTKGYITYMVGMNHKIFAMQVGCGIDNKAYAMAYAKHFNKPHISCGVVLNNGTLPILEYMNL